MKTFWRWITGRCLLCGGSTYTSTRCVACFLEENE
jgi:hypothetical protein